VPGQFVLVIFAAEDREGIKREFNRVVAAAKCSVSVSHQRGLYAATLQGGAMLIYLVGLDRRGLDRLRRGEVVPANVHMIVGEQLPFRCS
jgi:hypothetical protein